MPQTAAAHTHPDILPTPRKSGWSDARRAQHAASIRRWKPWVKSTGPRTVTGKSRSALNAYKHGQYALQIRLMRQALQAQSQFLKMFKIYRCLKQQKVGNELLAGLRSRLLLLDKIFRVRLDQSRHSPDYGKILLLPGQLQPPAKESGFFRKTAVDKGLKYTEILVNGGLMPPNFPLANQALTNHALAA